ncbi:hypothetical protein BDV33DRAFT_182344 [Aspergillus novoparasiticus]|uniref:Uncharacterized protein n=1 Tax=Aspergillus novoparasiticus TaxID=986946 RepID=A0A5N6ECS1_9EURO|nr:hypothetical protein BDV33DRAFT_182344 [Aspergillus novoparasiticus]
MPTSGSNPARDSRSPFFLLRLLRLLFLFLFIFFHISFPPFFYSVCLLWSYRFSWRFYIVNFSFPFLFSMTFIFIFFFGRNKSSAPAPPAFLQILPSPWVYFRLCSHSCSGPLLCDKIPRGPSWNYECILVGFTIRPFVLGMRA